MRLAPSAACISAARRRRVPAIGPRNGLARIRTPLTSIIGWIQLLRLERDEASLSEGLDTIDRNARAQSRLIEDILDFSRIIAGKLRLDVRPVDLSEVIDAAIDIVRPAADAKGVRIERSSTREAGHVPAMPTDSSRSCGTCSRTQ